MPSELVEPAQPVRSSCVERKSGGGHKRASEDSGYGMRPTTGVPTGGAAIAESNYRHSGQEQRLAAVEETVQCLEEGL
jgi:hypothetical protein